MEDPVEAAIMRMEALCDSVLFKLESCLERFDQVKYETTVTKLKFLGQKYLALRQVCVIGEKLRGEGCYRDFLFTIVHVIHPSLLFRVRTLAIATAMPTS